MEFEAMYNRRNRSNPTFTTSTTNTSTYHSLGPFTGANSVVSRQASAPLTSPTENTEETDISSRPRLTQEQITILEQEFNKLPKPNTDFKKELADRIGLTLARINNWYQNRRAKTKNGAKHTEAQFEVRTEDQQLIWPSFDQPFQTLTSYFDMGSLPAQSREVVDPNRPEDHRSAETNYFGGDSFDFQFDSAETDMPEVVPAHGHDLGFSHLNPGTELCPPGFAIPSECKMPIKTEMGDYGLAGYSPDTPVGFAIPQDLPTEQTTETMYHMEDDGYLVGNSSNQTFMSATSSSDGEQPTMMTPPEKPSPTMFLPQDAFDRRPSVTGILASHFQNSFHLQRQGSGQAMYEKPLNASKTRLVSPAHASPTASPVQWKDSTASPSLGLNTSAENTIALTRVDLAARRKRPRPAPLMRPDAQRSHSYTGPLTASPPSARKSLLNPSQHVRRIRSNLDVVNGRVQKPRSSSAQHSPRHLDNQFHDSFTPDRSFQGMQNTFQSPPTPLSAVYASDEALGYPQVGDSNQTLGTPAVDNHFILNSPPTTPYEISPFTTERPQEAFLGHKFEAHQPPQSAPPQKTSFFLGDSPPMPNCTPSHLSWQAPDEGSYNQFSEQCPTITVQPRYHPPSGQYEQAHVPSTYVHQQPFQNPPQHLVPSQLQTSFNVPQPQFHPTPEHLYQNSHQHSFPQYHSLPMPLYEQNVYELQPQQQQLEIKVELGPQPKGPPQPRKQYTFSNSTPDDFSPPKDER